MKAVLVTLACLFDPLWKEWYTSGRHDSSETIEMVRNIVDAGFVLHRVGSHAGPDKIPTRMLKISNEELPRALVEKVAAKARSQANLWWKHKSAVS